VAKSIEIKVPDLGGASDVEIIELLVGVEESVEIEDSLLTLESDKASMDIPAPLAGVIESINVKVGDSVNEGDVIMVVRETESSVNAEDSLPTDAEDSLPKALYQPTLKALYQPTLRALYQPALKALSQPALKGLSQPALKALYQPTLKARQNQLQRLAHR